MTGQLREYTSPFMSLHHHIPCPNSLNLVCRPSFLQLRHARCACSTNGAATAAFPAFLPEHLCGEFEDPDIIALLQSYKQVHVDVGGDSIKTAFLGPCLKGQQESQSSLPPVLLLHGFDSNVLEWRRVFGKLANITPTYAVDILGCVPLSASHHGGVRERTIVRLDAIDATTTLYVQQNGTCGDTRGVIDF